MPSAVPDAFCPTSLLPLIERLYAAVQTDALWDEVLREIAQHLSGESIALFAGAPDVRTPALIRCIDMDHAAWNQYADYFAAINPIMQRSERRLSPTQTWFSHEVMTDRELLESEFGADFFRPNNMHYSVGMRVSVPGQPAANLSCQRPLSDGAFGAHANAVLQTLRPHLAQALQLRRNLHAMQAQVLGLGTALELFDHAVLTLEEDGCVAFCSAPAETLLAAGYGLFIHGRRLRCHAPAADAELQNLIHAALALYPVPRQPRSRKALLPASASPAQRADTHDCGALLLPLEGGDTLSVSVLPQRGPHDGMGRAVRALVFLSHSARMSGSRSALLRCLYGLSPTEARVADCLASGLDTAEMAARLHLTRETSRWYIKQLLHKTGTRRQTDCLRRILALPAL